MKSKKQIQRLLDALSSLKVKMFVARINAIGNLSIKEVEDATSGETIVDHYLEILRYITEDNNTDFDDVIKTVLGE